MPELGLTYTVANELTVMVVFPKFTQPLASVTITVYVIVDEGVETGLAIFESFNAVPGIQE